MSTRNVARQRPSKLQRISSLCMRRVSIIRYNLLFFTALLSRTAILSSTTILSNITILSSATIFCSTVYAETDKNFNTKLSELGYEQGAPVDRVEHYRVNGWNYIDDRHIVIYAGPSNRFLITTFSNCSDLSSAENIGFTTTTSAVTKFDKLIVRGAGGIVQNCPITQINALTKTATKH